MPNLESIIAKHNAKIANPKSPVEEDELCNCRKRMIVEWMENSYLIMSYIKPQ